jgi:tetratricopeptide (TPR) repeat protein/tRNA A-37 threonylcarbamoyl transferase component Bud32
MTKAERWKVVEDLFHRALDVPDEERTAFIEAEAGGDADVVREVQSLIESDSAASNAMSVAATAVKKALATFHAAETSATSPGRIVGRYRLTRELGRGGMGTVYLATRADNTYEKDVALKLVRRGMDTDFILARFRRERQILASLEHPNIARLLDGGATDDGLPYLVMEYVQGVSITDYVRQNDVALEQRLRLFLQICDAVDYAHRNFVVHRDIKPSNILVDGNGVPKLLDFGISKLLVFDGVTTQTVTQDVRLLTPDYASPEQIRGQTITAAADIYSLGAVLFELLTDSKPHRFEKSTPQALEETICETEIQRPSEAAKDAGRQTIWRKLQGDLDNIVLLAMRKDPKRRYSSAHDFAQDIRAYLDHKPVSARSDAMVYRTRKFLRRNWGPVVAVSAVILALAVGIYRERREARVARMHFQQVRRLANTFVTDVHDQIRNLPGSTRARSTIVKTGLDYLETLAKNAEGDLDLQREIGSGYMRIGDVQGSVLETNLGDTTGALASYNKALQLLEEVARRRPNALDVQSEILSIHRRIGDIYVYTKSTTEALRSYAHARATGETVLARKPDDIGIRRSVADLYQAQSRTFRLADDPESAREAAERAIELYRDVQKKLPDDLGLRRDMASTLAAEGMALSRLARRQDALARFQQAVQESEFLAQRQPDNVMTKRALMLAYSHVGDLLSEPGYATPAEMSQALDAYLKVDELAAQLQKADPADYRALTDRGIALMRVANATPEGGTEKLRRYTESLGYLRQAAQTRKDLMLQLNMAFVETRMADILRRQGATAEANRYLREAVQLGDSLLTVDPKNSSARRTLIDGLRWLGEDAAKRRNTREAAEYRARLLKAGEDLKRQRDLPLRSQAYLARAYAGAGAVSALCGDKQVARENYQTAVLEYKRLASEPGFASRKELEEAEAELAALR